MTKHPSKDDLEELFQLAEEVRAKSPKLYQRIQIVLLVIDLGYTYKTVAKKLTITPKTVGKWVKRYKDQGKAGLLDAPRCGRHPTISEDIRSLVVRVAQTDAGELTDHLSSWSVRTLQRYLLQVYQVDISPSSISRILSSHGITFRKVEETMVSPDPDYEIKKKRIEDARVEAEHNDDMAFLCLDEKGPIHALYHRGKKWMDQWVRQLIPRNHNKSNGQIVLNAAFEPATNRLWWHFSERRTGEAFLTLLITLSMDPVLQRLKKVYLLMDNLPAHFTQNIRDFLLLHPQLVVLRLPTYSPELNPIERVFSDLDRQAIQNYYYDSVATLQQRISSWLEDRMTLPVKVIKAVSPRKTHRQRWKRIMYLK